MTALIVGDTPTGAIVAGELPLPTPGGVAKKITVRKESAVIWSAQVIEIYRILRGTPLHKADVNQLKIIGKNIQDYSPYKIPTFERTTDQIRIFYASRVTTQALTWNVPRSVAETAVRNQSLKRAYRAAVRSLRRRLNRDVPLLLVGELADGAYKPGIHPPGHTLAGRFHLHGGICATNEELPAIRLALSEVNEAFGISGNFHTSNAVVLREIKDPTQWGTYLIKSFNFTKGAVASPFSISRSLNQQARELYERDSQFLTDSFLT